MSVITYKIKFEDNRGSRPIDAIASSVNGSWHDSSDNQVFLDIPEDAADDLEYMLDGDNNVISYAVV